MYGCGLKEDNIEKNLAINNNVKVFPYLFAERKPYFSIEKCFFNTKKDK